MHVLIEMCPEGKVFALEVEEGDTIDIVKAKIVDIENLPGCLLECSRLSIDGEFLDEGGRTLKDYNIQNGLKLMFL